MKFIALNDRYRSLLNLELVISFHYWICSSGYSIIFKTMNGRDEFYYDSEVKMNIELGRLQIESGVEK